MRHERTNRIGRWLALLLLTLASTFFLAAPAQAAAYAPHTASDTLALTLDNGTSFTYGGTPAPTFTAVVTFGTKPTANYFWQVSGQLEDGETFGTEYPPTSSPDGMMLTFTHMTATTPFKVGQHNATATFYDPGTKTTATSNLVSFTIIKANSQLDCGIDGNAEHFEGAGQSLHISMSPTGYQTQESVDWQDGTYSVAFDGPTHLTFSNLAPDSNDGVTVTGPTKAGYYQLTCGFSGTPSFNSSTSTATRYTFSAMHSLGSVQLFTNPTTLAAQQNLEFYVVFHPAPGLPTPTGGFQIYAGQYYTNELMLGPNGDYLIHLNPLPSVSGINQINIRYWGDLTYNEAYFTFPVTNPPIPGGGNGGSGGSSGSFGGGSASSTPRATGTASASTTPTGTATQTAVDSSAAVSSITSAHGSNSPLWLIVVLTLVILAGLGGAAVVIYRARRAKSSAQSDAVATPTEFHGF